MFLPIHVVASVSCLFEERGASHLLSLWWRKYALRHGQEHASKIYCILVLVFILQALGKSHQAPLLAASELIVASGLPRHDLAQPLIPTLAMLRIRHSLTNIRRASHMLPVKGSDARIGHVVAASSSTDVPVWANCEPY